jgi:hypothetical protein
MALKLDIDLFNEFGKRLIDDTKASLDSNGSTASGKTKDSLRYELNPTSFKFYGRAFINTLEVGRKPTSAGGDGSLKKAIRQWIDDKNIIPDGISKDSLAFLISRKIHREGDLLHSTGSNFQGKTSPTQIIYGVINDGRLKQLKNSLLFDVVTQVKKELSDAYNTNT